MAERDGVGLWLFVVAQTSADPIGTVSRVSDVQPSEEPLRQRRIRQQIETRLRVRCHRGENHRNFVASMSDWPWPLRGQHQLFGRRAIEKLRSLDSKLTCHSADTLVKTLCRFAPLMPCQRAQPLIDSPPK
jgi:hypothetical protein